MKTCFVMLVLVSVGLRAVAQEKPAYGFRIGYNVSEVSKAGNSKMRPLGGICLGFYTDVTVTKRIHFQPELLYSIQGSRNYHTDPQTGESAGQSSLVIKYVNLPMIFKVYFGERFNIQVGAQIGRLISSVNKGVAFNQPFVTNYTRNLMSIDYSLLLGAAFHFNEHYNAGLRFNYGVSSIYKATDNPEVDPVYSNRVGCIFVGYTF